MSGLEQYELDGLLVYKEGLERNIKTMEKSLADEKAKLDAVELEIKVRERQEV